MKFVLATRGSPLALWQANETRRLLLALHPTWDVELMPVVSAGDKDSKTELARFGLTGIFTAEVDHAVLSGAAQAGVHSLKDMTTTLHAGLVLGSCLTRGPAEDVLLTRTGARLDALAPGSRVATGSVRRIAMVRRLRPDLELVGIRGNVDTRLRKRGERGLDAVVLAACGLDRLGLDGEIGLRLDPEVMLPEAGQGALALQVRTGEEMLVAAAEDPETRRRVEHERACVAAVGGGCLAPVAAFHDGTRLRALIADPDGRWVERCEGDDGRLVGAELAARAR